LASKTAFAGDDSGRKGIIQLREDILKVLRPNDFGGIFRGLVEIPAAMIGYRKNTGGTNWVTSIMISRSRTVPKIERDTTGCKFKKLSEERYTDAEVCAKILETISGATELCYVKSFTLGDMNVSRALYPFINVGNTHVSVEAHDIVNDIRRYTVTLSAGTHSLAGNLAYDGNGADKKGIVELCSDIVSVVRQNYFGGGFFKPVQSLSVDTEALSDRAGFMRIGTVRFTGECFVRRS